MATLKKVAEEIDELREFGEWLDLDQKQRAADPLTANLADHVWLLKALQRYEHYLGPPETTGHTSSAKIDPKKAARSMFELADRFDSNGELTLAEMHTFLSHDLEWGLFVDWLTRDVHSKMFHAMDGDGTGTLNEVI